MKTKTSVIEQLGIHADYKFLPTLNIEAWEKYTAYRRFMKFKPLKTLGKARKLAELNPDDQMKRVQMAMDSEWQGLPGIDFPMPSKPDNGPQGLAQQPAMKEQTPKYDLEKGKANTRRLRDMIGGTGVLV